MDTRTWHYIIVPISYYFGLAFILFEVYQSAIFNPVLARGKPECQYSVSALSVIEWHMITAQVNIDLFRDQILLTLV